MTRLGVLLSVAILACVGWTGSAQAADWPHWLGPNSNGISDEALPQADWSASPPKVLWKKSVGEGFAIVSVIGGRAYTTGNAKGEDTVWCLDAVTGKEVWKFSYPCEAGQHPGTPRLGVLSHDAIEAAADTVHGDQQRAEVADAEAP